MLVSYDYREDRTRIPRLLQQAGLELHRTNLLVGDYIVGDIAIERKTINDYIASKESGELDNQLYALSYNFDLSYLVIEGYVSKALMYRKITRQAYISSLVGSSLKRASDGKKGQVITVNLETDFDTALFIQSLASKLSNPEARKLVLKRPKPGSNDLIKYILLGLPGIGPKRADLLIKKFKSIRNLANASVDEIKSVPGFGNMLAGQVYRILNQEVDSNVNGAGSIQDR